MIWKKFQWVTYILSGGEVAAMAFLDSVIRLLPNAIGNIESTTIESFSNGLLEYPQYTKPNEFDNKRNTSNIIVRES